MVPRFPVPLFFQSRFFSVPCRRLTIYLCRSDMTALAVLASSPVVGSSRNKMPGLMMSSIPIFVRFRSPPETPRMNSVPTCSVAILKLHSHKRSVGLLTPSLSSSSSIIISTAPKKNARALQLSTVKAKVKP